MRVEENNAGDGGGVEAGREEVDNEDSGGDEADIAGFVEREAVVQRQIGGDLGDGDAAAYGVVLDGLFLGRGRRKEEKGALGRVVEGEERVD